MVTGPARITVNYAKSKEGRKEEIGSSCRLLPTFQTFVALGKSVLKSGFPEKKGRGTLEEAPFTPCTFVIMSLNLQLTNIAYIIILSNRAGTLILFRVFLIKRPGVCVERVYPYIEAGVVSINPLSILMGAIYACLVCRNSYISCCK